MEHPVLQSTIRLAVTLLAAAALAACGQGDDKGKTEKKVEPAPAPKAAPTPTPKKDAAPKAEAPGAGWTLLGQQQADHKTEKERIMVGTKEGRYKELRLTVKGAPLTIDEVVVTLGNKKEFRPKFKQELKDGESTRIIDLPGEERGIRHVDIVYRTTAKGTGKATVMLYGR